VEDFLLELQLELIKITSKDQKLWSKQGAMF
jgi:hypothetical protein